MPAVILTIDQGTTSSRVILFDANGVAQKTFRRELKCNYPQEGWVEQDASQIWQDCFEMCELAIAYAANNELTIHSIGITNQRETVVFFDKETQQPLAPAIVWQDRRSSDFCQELLESNHGDEVTRRTGLFIDAYFSASKIRWGLKNIEEVKAAAQCNRLAVGTIDSWLLFKLSKGSMHATDSSNASRTMLFDIIQHDWCDELLDLFSVPKNALPRVLRTIDDYGLTASGLFDITLPIKAMIGDQQAATIGQDCLAVGDGKCTLGTGAFAMQNIGSKFENNSDGLLTTILYTKDKVIHYASEGSIFSSGSTLQWLRDSLGVIEHAADSELMAKEIDGAGGVFFVPAFNGLGSPHWQPTARALLCGISSKTSKKEIVRAALESVSYQCHDLFNDNCPSVLKVDGGMAANDWLLQHMSDILQCEIVRPPNIEATAWGAARCAGSELGLLKPIDRGTISDNRFRPQMDSAKRNQLLNDWHAAVTSCIRHHA
ncbi:MAG: glycerol kinase GlpK [Planctomycetes bacterium]|nr:glycerol kinase GlpK [Planctomycetota bacterium]